MDQTIRIKLKSYDYNLVDKSAEKIVKTVKATGAVDQRAYTPAHTPSRVHRQPLHFRQQEVARAVPALELQAFD